MMKYFLIALMMLMAAPAMAADMATAKLMGRCAALMKVIADTSAPANAEKYIAGSDQFRVAAEYYARGSDLKVNDVVLNDSLMIIEDVKKGGDKALKGHLDQCSTQDLAAKGEAAFEAMKKEGLSK